MGAGDNGKAFMRVACIRVAVVLAALTIPLLTSGRSPPSEAAAADCPTAPAVIQNGFLTGEDFLEQSERYQQGYAAGFVNGLMTSPFMGAWENCAKHYSECLAGTTDSQLAAVIRRWLKENPERWHEGSHIASWLAIRQMCE